MCGLGLARSGLMQKDRRRFIFVRDGAIGMPLPLSDIDFTPTWRCHRVIPRL
jgi:hypothetical protein